MMLMHIIHTHLHTYIYTYSILVIIYEAFGVLTIETFKLGVNFLRSWSRKFSRANCFPPIYVLLYVHGVSIKTKPNCVCHIYLMPDRIIPKLSRYLEK